MVTHFNIRIKWRLISYCCDISAHATTRFHCQLWCNQKRLALKRSLFVRRWFEIRSALVFCPCLNSRYCFISNPKLCVAILDTIGDYLDKPCSARCCGSVDYLPIIELAMYVCMCVCMYVSHVLDRKLLERLMSQSPKSQVMFASAFSWIGDFFVFLEFIVFYAMATLLNISICMQWTDAADGACGGRLALHPCIQ